VENSSPEMCATSVFFKLLSKVNNQPLGDHIGMACTLAEKVVAEMGLHA
jgi:hypothetical protein